MANKTLNIVVKATNIASREFKKINGELSFIEQRAKFAKGSLAALTAGVAFLGFSMVRAAAEFEQTQIAFTTMLGSAEKANTLLRELGTFAAQTPFELQDVEKGAKALLAFGIAETKIISTLKSLGDVSAGLSVPMERLILNFGQVKAQTKLTGRELRDFAIAGVPILDELATNLGKSKEEVIGLVSAGKIGFPEVEEAFRSMSSEGGRFNDLMAAQSRTLLGRISNLKDSWNLFLREQGNALIVFAGVAVDKLSLIVEWLRKDAEGFNIVGQTIHGLILFFKALGTTLWGIAKIAASFIALVIGGVGNIQKIILAFGKDTISVFKNIKKIGLSVFKAFGKAIKGDFKGASDTIKQEFTAAFSDSINSVDNFSNQAGAQLDEIGNISKGIATTWIDFAQLKGMDNTVEKFGALGTEIKDKVGGGSADATKEAKKLEDAFTKLNEKVISTTDSSVNALSKVSGKIKELNAKMRALTIGNIEENINLNQGFAEAFVTQEEKVADLRKQFGAETNADSKTSLQERLKFEESELAKFGTLEKTFANEIIEVRRKNGLSDIARMVEELNQKRILIEDEFKQKRKKIQDELNLEQEKQKKLIELQQFALDMSKKFLAEKELQTVDSVNRQIDLYNKLAKAISAAQQGKQSSQLSASSATIGAASQIVPSVNITVQGDVSGEDLINKVKNGIMGELSLNNNLG